MRIQRYKTTRLLIFLLLLAACNSANIRDIHTITSAGDPLEHAGKMLKKKLRYIAANPASLPGELKLLRAKFNKFKKIIDSIWGREAAQEAGPKDYVKYTDNYYNRAHIDFDAGTVTVATVAPEDQLDYLHKAIVTTLLTPADPREVDLYSAINPQAGKGKPFLYEQVLDQDGKAIAWPWRANRYADYLIKNRLRKVKIGRHYGLQVQFSLVAAAQRLRAYKYAPLVRKYSRKYNVTESLIYGIIKTESSFNPFAVSHAPAYGLMQIVPRTAGRDVFAKIKQRSGQPGPQYLYDPENNIDTGAAYLKILQEEYLAKISDHNARRYSVIAAYNGGAANVLLTFSANRDQAIKKINRLSASQVYRQLTRRHPRPESRRYLLKVTRAQQEFWNNAGFAGAE